MRLLPYVNPLQGTDSSGSLSRGSTMPIVAMPFGMAHWTLQTDDGWGWQFQPRSPKLQGIRLTHQPSPWMGDYGAFLVMPQIGARVLPTGRRGTTWRVDKALVKPNRMHAELVACGVHMETAPTERGAVFRFRYPDGSNARLIIDGVKGETHFEIRPDGLLVGWNRGNSGGVPKEFACYFVAKLTVPITSWATFKGETLGPVGEARTGDQIGICLELGKVREVTMRVGTSFISVEQAILNLQREIGSAGLEEIAKRAEDTWEKTLGQVEIETEDETAKRTFYSCLYRTKLFPRMWHEIDANGKTVHFSPYDGQVHDGPLYADTGFWDTFRTQHPLLTLLEPKRQNEMLQGWINAYHESGWLPQWPSPGHRVSMPGTHMDATIADAVAKGIRDFDIETALTGMLRHADGPARGGPIGAGRNDVESYLKYGYSTSGGAVAQTLDYAYDDWAIGETAAFLGKHDVAARMRERALNYKKIYDPQTGFMRAKKADGSWAQEPFDPYYWGGPYVEGGPWQSSWAVQHDPAGLMALMGGQDAFAKKLDLMLSTPPYFNVGGYGQEIHEMTEMAVRDFGQYAHGNQPVHHVLYLYHAAGRPWRTQKEVRRAMSDLYSPDGFAGDEDNGEMAAWYVLSSLGLYPHCPGRAEWALGSPVFKKARIHLSNGRTLVIDAPENSAKNVYVSETSLRGHVFQGATVSHADLLAGGALHFHMAAAPVTRVTPVAARLGSLSKY